MGRWTTGIERLDDPNKPLEATGPDGLILVMRIVFGVSLGFIPAAFTVALWLPHERANHYELLVPLALLFAYPIQALLFYGQPFGHDMKLGKGKLPANLNDWPLEIRHALDAAENALENPWNGAGRKNYRTRKAVKILREALPKATGESAEFVAQEIKSLERLLNLLARK